MPAAHRSPYDREIVALALPALGALAAEPLYLLADTAIVGHLGTTQLAALALAATALGAVTTVFNFLVYGTTAQVARAHGGGNAARAHELGSQAVWLGLALGCVLAVATLVLATPVVTLLGRHGEVASLAARYLRISAAGAPGRAARDRRPGLPARHLGAAPPARDRDRGERRRTSALELVLVYGLGLGLDGSALGTVDRAAGDGGGVPRRGLAAAASAPAADARARPRRRRDRDPHQRPLRVVRRRERGARAGRQGVAGRPPGRLPALQPARARARRARDRRPGAGRAHARRGRRRGRLRCRAAPDGALPGGGVRHRASCSQRSTGRSRTSSRATHA